MLDEREENRREKLRALVEEGWQSAKRGELLDGDEVFDRLQEELELIEQASGEEA